MALKARTNPQVQELRMKQPLTLAVVGFILATGSSLAADKATHTRVAATEMIGTLPTGAVPITDYYNQTVYDSHDNKIGTINDLLLDKNGKVEAVMVGVGGFLGIGEKNVAVPFSAFKVADKDGSRYLILDTTKDALQSAPGYIYDRDKKVWIAAKQA
jgi:sporulation protein YlmC with PRC-barrel domain